MSWQGQLGKGESALSAWGRGTALPAEENWGGLGAVNWTLPYASANQKSPLFSC